MLFFREAEGGAPHAGFYPGLVFGAPLGHSDRLTFPEVSCASTRRQRDRAGASVGPIPRSPPEELPLVSSPGPTTRLWE